MHNVDLEKYCAKALESGATHVNKLEKYDAAK